MKLLYPIFESYYEAISKLNFCQDMYVIKITDYPGSLEKIRDDKNIVIAIGCGKMKSPGHPSGNQQNINQLPILQTLINFRQIPVLHKFRNGTVEYLGMFRHLDTKIKVSNEGFRYYEYKMQRYNITDAD
jgi:hypothetical protein